MRIERAFILCSGLYHWSIKGLVGARIVKSALAALIALPTALLDIGYLALRSLPWRRAKPHEGGVIGRAHDAAHSTAALGGGAAASGRVLAPRPSSEESDAEEPPPLAEQAPSRRPRREADREDWRPTRRARARPEASPVDAAAEEISRLERECAEIRKTLAVEYLVWGQFTEEFRQLCLRAQASLPEALEKCSALAKAIGSTSVTGLFFRGNRLIVESADIASLFERAFQRYGQTRTPEEWREDFRRLSEVAGSSEALKGALFVRPYEQAPTTVEGWRAYAATLRSAVEERRALTILLEQKMQSMSEWGLHFWENAAMAGAKAALKITGAEELVLAQRIFAFTSSLNSEKLFSFLKLPLSNPLHDRIDALCRSITLESLQQFQALCGQYSTLNTAWKILSLLSNDRLTRYYRFGKNSLRQLVTTIFGSLTEEQWRHLHRFIALPTADNLRAFNNSFSLETKAQITSAMHSLISKNLVHIFFALKKKHLQRAQVGITTLIDPLKATILERITAFQTAAEPSFDRYIRTV